MTDTAPQTSTEDQRATNDDPENPRDLVLRSENNEEPEATADPATPDEANPTTESGDEKEDKPKREVDTGRVIRIVQNIVFALLAFSVVLAVYWYFFRRPEIQLLEDPVQITQQNPPPAPLTIAPESVIFQDTFEFSRESWEVAPAGEAVVDRGAMILNDMPFVDRGILAIDNLPFDGEAFARPHLVFDNFIFNTHTRWLSGAVGGRYGIRFRLQDEDNFYAFYLSNEGRYIIGKTVGGEWREVTSDYHNAIALGGGVNLIQIEANGSNMRFFVNGTYITDMTDAEFGGGDIAIIAERTGTTDTYMVAFDNLTVGRIPPTPSTQ